MKALSALLASALFAGVAHAGAPPPPPFAEPVGVDAETGEAIYRLDDLVSSARIFGGTQSVPGEFPAMGWIGNCTATAVAPNVVLTAGHCQATGAGISFEHRGSGRTYRATCTRHPQYNAQTINNDYTLCKLSEPLPAGSVLGTLVKASPAVGTKVLLNGYGEPNVRVHYWGSSNIARFESQDLVTCGNPSTLGHGDSGGALLEWTDDRSLRSGFRIIAVNSRGNYTCDWYNQIADPAFQTFAAQYERSNGVQLCGFSAQCGGGSEPPEPGPVDCGAELVGVVQAKEALAAAVDKLSACMLR